MRFIKALVLSLPAVGMTLGGISAVVAFNSMLAAPAHAADKKAASDKQVSAKVGKPLKEAMELAQAKNFKGAMAKLQEAQAVSGKTPYDDYKINEITSYVAANLGDTATATKAIDAMLDSPESTPETRKRQLDQLVKFHFQTKNYDKSIQYGSRYLKEVGPDTDIAFLMAQAYYAQNDFPQAVTAFQSLIRIADQAGQPVKRDWLAFLYECQQRAGKNDDAATTLGMLLAKYPSPEYWRAAFAIEQNKGGSSDRKSLEMFRLKLVTGVLNDSDYINMVELSFALGFPGDAKMVLEKGFANKVLNSGADKDRATRYLDKAQTESAADLKQLPTYEKETMAKPTGDGDVKLGYAYGTYGEYDKGIEAMKRGLKKGGLRAEDEAHMLLGVTYVNAKKPTDAIAQFKAVPADSKLAGLAHLWIIYLNSKS